MDIDQRRDLARKLLSHARIAAAVIRRGSRLPVGSTLAAVAAASTMRDLADEVLHELVDDARTLGHTWQEIGDTLGTSRQAAFERFTAD